VIRTNLSPPSSPATAFAFIARSDRNDAMNENLDITGQSPLVTAVRLGVTTGHGPLMSQRTVAPVDAARKN